MFFTAHSYLCVSEWKEYFSYFWRLKDRQTDNWTPTLTHLSFLLYISVFSLISHTHNVLLCVCVCAPSPQSQLSTHHLCVTVIPLVITYGTPLPCMEDLNRPLWPWLTSNQPYRERHHWWNTRKHKYTHLHIIYLQNLCGLAQNITFS